VPRVRAALSVRAVEADSELLAELRAGREEAFVRLVERYHGHLLRLAATMVPSRAVAEEVVQDTWMAVMRGADRFEGRSSFKTWLFRILANRARSAGAHEGRSGSARGPAVDPACFDQSGAWLQPVEPWTERVDDVLDAARLGPALRSALEALPSRQRQVVVLRDVEGLSSDEVCGVLGVSKGNERVLLHRGRAGLRQALDVQMGRG
jgi:RNA polymerase sigma-70 factor (ECF subfamily)